MAINFNELPSSNPNAPVPKGCYKAKVLKAEMKTNKDPQKPAYLSVTFQLFNDKGEPIAKLFDILTEPSADVTRFKLKRFVHALQVPLQTFELKDLTKISEGKEMYVDVTIQEGTERYPAPKNVTDVFAADIYYALDEKTPLDSYVPGGEDPVFDALDAEDATPNNEGGASY